MPRQHLHALIRNGGPRRPGASTNRAAGLLVLLGLLGPTATPRAFGAAGVVPTDFTDALVVGGLRRPIGMAMLPDARLLFLEQFTARIRLIVDGALAVVDPVCTVPDVQNNTGSEQGLLGIAVDPAWPSRPYVYVHYDDAATPTIHIARFTVSGDLDFVGDGSLTIDPATRHDILTAIPDNASNHNGGTLRFGPDRMLYVSLGEDAQPCAAQDTTLLQGKILRLDVAGLPAGPGGPPPPSAITPANNPFVAHANPNARLVWALGLRNPFRFSIDATGEVFVADVGQDSWEEIDRVPSGGLDLGWPFFEGPDAYQTCPGASGLGMTAPIHFYAHTAGSDAVIGGPVYRAPACPLGSPGFPPEYDGDYFFTDYYKGFLRRLKGSGSSWSLAPPAPGQPNASDWGSGFQQVSDWLVGCDGALWYCRQSTGFQDNTGEIRRIAYGGQVGVPLPRFRVDFRPPWPSPARGVVYFDYGLSLGARVELTLYDVMGRPVRRIVAPGMRPAGAHRATWDTSDERGSAAPPGIYLARLRVDRAELVRRFPLIR